MWAWLSQLMEEVGGAASTAAGAIGSAASSVGSTLGSLFSGGSEVATAAAPTAEASAGVADASKAAFETANTASSLPTQMPQGAGHSADAALPTAPQAQTPDAEGGGLMKPDSTAAMTNTNKIMGSLGNVLQSLSGDSQAFAKMTGLDPKMSKTVMDALGSNPQAEAEQKQRQIAQQQRMDQMLAQQQQQVWGTLGGYNRR